MSTAFDKLERRFGRFAIPNLTLCLLAGQILVWVLEILQVLPRSTLMLFPQAVFAGEVWRVVSFLIVPPVTGITLWAPFVFLMFYWYGTTLENTWGTFRYNCFVLLGTVLTVAIALLAYLLLPPAALAPGFVTNGYLLGAIFMAFVLINPNYEILLFFVLPVKVRWLGWFMLFVWVVTLLTSPLLVGLSVLAALATLAIFFTRGLMDASKMKRRAESYRAERRAIEAEPFHRCSVCGVTDQDEPDLRFAYKDGKGYCERHWDQMDEEQTR